MNYKVLDMIMLKNIALINYQVYLELGDMIEDNVNQKNVVEDYVN